MALLEEIRAKKSQLLTVAAQYGVSDIRVFGSVARGEENGQSDIDLLVHLADGKDYLDLAGFQCSSAQILKRHTDVVLDTSLNKYIAASILEDATPL